MLANLRFRRHRERLYTWLIVLAGLAIAVIAAWLARDHSMRQASEGFQREVSARSAAFDASIARHVQMVRSLAAFVATRDQLQATDFRAFVDSMRGGIPGMQAMQWMPVVSAAQRQPFEQAAQSDYANYRLTEQVSLWELVQAHEREQYVAVRLVEPLAGNEPVVGFDALSDPLLADALARAAASGDVVATERLVLVQDDDGVRYGVMLVSAVPGRDGSVRGYVAGVFRIGDLLQAALAGLPPVGLHFSVTDASGPGAERALHVFSDRLTDVGDLLETPFDPQEQSSADTLLATHDLRVGDRLWRVYYEAGPGYFAPLPPVPAWAAALVVLLVTAMVTALLLLMQKRAQLLARSSLADGLTGLANRAFCDRMLAAEWDRAIRFGKPLSVVVVDIDHFADYNAQFGPLAGDDCLRRVGHALAEVPARSSDFVCRYSGDRFVVILPETPHAGAHALAGRAARAVLALGMAHPGRTPEPVVSVSVVAATAQPARGDSLPGFIGKAVDLLDSADRGDGNAVLGLSVAAG